MTERSNEVEAKIARVVLGILVVCGVVLMTLDLIHDYRDSEPTIAKLFDAIPGYDTTQPRKPEIAANPAIRTGKVIVWADHRSGRIRRTFAGAMGVPLSEPIPHPPTRCLASVRGTFWPAPPASAIWLCPEGGLGWGEWAIVSPPPLVPCTAALAHVSMNGYVCDVGRYWRGKLYR